MISYMILHYNRPYLLDINIKIVRKYAPAGTQIVVADDGSCPEVLEVIKKYDIDDLFIQEKKNQNQWVEGTCSNTIASARKLLKHKFFVFSEDDFFFCPNPVNDKGFGEWEIMPKQSYKTENPCTIFQEAVQILSDKKAVNVSLSRDSLGWRPVPTRNDFTIGNNTWKYLDHVKKNRFYYCNWPSMMRVKDYQSVPIPPNKAIWSFEGILTSNMDKKFGKSDWTIVPEHRRYIHVGMPFSKRKNSFTNSAAKRARVVKDLQNLLFEKISVNDIESFNKIILELWQKGKFFIDFDELMETDLQNAFYKAFERVEDSF
jgi:hypothetical protein